MSSSVTVVSVNSPYCSSISASLAGFAAFLGAMIAGCVSGSGCCTLTGRGNGEIGVGLADTGSGGRSSKETGEPASADKRSVLWWAIRSYSEG